jgi:hypothetical protein
LVHLSRLRLKSAAVAHNHGAERPLAACAAEPGFPDRHGHPSFVRVHGVSISRVLAEARRPPFDLTHAGGWPRRKIRTPRCSQINTVQPAQAIDADKTADALGEQPRHLIRRGDLD